MGFARGNGIDIGFEVLGDGPPLLLHPGMFQVGAAWTAAGYTKSLMDDYSVILMDPLGLGTSSAPSNPDAYSLPRRAESVVAVLDAVGADRAAFWGYSLGALTGYAVAMYAPERISRLVAGGFDPVNGFASTIEPTLRALDLSYEDDDPYPALREAARADPAMDEVISASDPAALRANFEAFSFEPGVHAALAAVDIPMLLYAGTADPWHEPTRCFAARTGTDFFALAGADHPGAWSRCEEALDLARPFLAQRRAQKKPTLEAFFGRTSEPQELTQSRGRRSRKPQSHTRQLTTLDNTVNEPQTGFGLAPGDVGGPPPGIRCQPPELSPSDSSSS